MENLKDEIKSCTLWSDQEVDQWLSVWETKLKEVAKKNKTSISREAFYLLKKDGKLHFQCPVRRLEYSIEYLEQLEDKSFSNLFYWQKIRKLSKELTYLTILIYILLAGVLLSSKSGTDFVVMLIGCLIMVFSHYIIVSNVSLKKTHEGVRNSAFGNPSTLSKFLRKFMGDDNLTPKSENNP